jgi:pimeloyl-CoA synthetase
MKVVSIAQNESIAHFLQLIDRYRLNRSIGPNGHENGSFDFMSVELEKTCARISIPGFQLKF